MSDGGATQGKRRYHIWTMKDDRYILGHWKHGATELAREMNERFGYTGRAELTPATVRQRHHKLEELGLTDLRCAGCGLAIHLADGAVWCPERGRSRNESAPACGLGLEWELMVMRGEAR